MNYSERFSGLRISKGAYWGQYLPMLFDYGKLPSRNIAWATPPAALLLLPPPHFLRAQAWAPCHNKSDLSCFTIEIHGKIFLSEEEEADYWKDLTMTYK